MKKLVVVLLSLMIGFTSFKEKPKSRVILAIFAHPDDEIAIGPVLAKYAKNNKVYLIIATDGRNGVRDHAGIPAGDSLAHVRKAEAICSCKELGIQSPIFLGYHDGMGTATGIGEFFRQSKLIKEKLKQKIEELNPEVIITEGPDGDTGHSDHRMINDITVEILLQEGWLEKFPLYHYVARTSKQIKKKPINDLSYVDEKYVDVSISFTEEDELRAWQAAKCHKSQITEKEIEYIRNELKQDKTNTLYFRRFAINKKIKKDFFQ